MCLESRTIFIFAIYLFLFTFGLSSLVILQSYMTTTFRLTSFQVFSVGLVFSVVGFTSLICSGCIIPKLGALLGIAVASTLATSGMFFSSSFLLLPPPSSSSSVSSHLDFYFCPFLALKTFISLTFHTSSFPFLFHTLTYTTLNINVELYNVVRFNSDEHE